MSYSPPNTFVAGTAITAADVSGNFDALKIYLHTGIAAGDIDSKQWIDTSHIQPPEFESFTSVQHGVSGHQGGQWGGGVGVRLAFCTKFLTLTTAEWAELQNASFSIDVRRQAKIIFHYWYEVECGPDDSTDGQQVTEADRLVWVAPYIGNISLRRESEAQEAQNHQEGWNVVTPIGPKSTYPSAGAYGQRDGSVIFDAPQGTATFGLCYYSQIDRVAVVNWGVAIEAYYI